MKLVKSILISALLFSMFLAYGPSSAEAAKVKGFDYKPGDVLITKSYSSYKLVGHAGIVLPDGKNVLFTSTSNNKKPYVWSISKWLDHYDTTKVVRHKSTTVAGKAAKNAYDNYWKTGAKYKNSTYKVSTDPTNRKYLYCSEIVWQAYYYGAGVDYQMKMWNQGTSRYIYVRPSIVKPYFYVDTELQKHNGFSTVKKINWN
ncbi:YiiX/YebB-like N1pC/P60 family cysteine hydrolase [Fictibacillus sp. B-59209]|uniref:hypothetical protein n=1 Tax=Fictibacillus sp. B-59209 TaxID=3024873 RepID=UPI002E1D40B2|nr:YiiX/YebB-like N1pC/P60 family cysteine hydrolase [Fictibacillus sp. B-59209]